MASATVFVMEAIYGRDGLFVAARNDGLGNDNPHRQDNNAWRGKLGWMLVDGGFNPAFKEIGIYYLVI